MSIYKGTTLIAGSLPNSANQDLSNLSQTGQAVIDSKADTDLSNATDNGKILMSSMGLPSETYIDLTLGASGTQYTAPANGWFSVSKYATAANQILVLQSTSTGYGFKYASSSSQGCLISCPVKKGDKIFCSYTTTGTTEFFRFFYAVGSESEAQ